MRQTAKWIAGLIAALLAGVGVIWALRPSSLTVETEPAIRTTLEATVTAEGKTRVRNLFVVAAPVDGELERISLKPGDVVTPSTAVAHIWPIAPRPLDARSRAEALAALASARAALLRADAGAKEAEAALTHAESTRDTTRTLANRGAIGEKEFEHAEHELEIRRQALAANRASAEAARADVARAEATLSSSTTSGGRTATTVRAPTGGRVLRVLHESAGAVAAGTPLLELGDITSIEIAADFLTTDAMTIQPGTRATIRDWGGPQSLSALVRQIEPGGFTKVSALGLEEQRVTVILDLVNAPPAGFGHDFHVNVDAVVWTGTDVLTIPSTALFRVGEDWAVYVIRGDRARLTRIRAGHSSATRSVIEQGLVDGDRVIVQPSDAVRDGSRISTAGGTS